MKFETNLNQKEYENFVSTHQTKSHFMQSYTWGQISKEKNMTPHYVGLKQNNKLVATALLLEKKLLGKRTYLYCPRGFVCDYQNETLLKEFTKHLKEYAKKLHAIYIKIDPDIKLQERNIEGEIETDKPNNFQLIKTLETLGHKHLGFNQNFEHNEPRYTFRLDLTQSEENIINNMHLSTKKIIKKGNPYNLEIYKGTKEDIKDFYHTMLETEKRQNATFYPIKYYQTFYEKFHKQNQSDLYIVKVNIEKLKQEYQEKINKIEVEQQKLKDTKLTKHENKIKDLENQKQKLLKETEEINQIKEKELILSSIITVKYNDKVWTVHGGNDNRLRYLNANYLIYNTIIMDAKKEGYKIIDFFGTTGNPDPNNPIYGIHLFKKRLGGEYIEFIGEFDLITNKPLYYTYNTLIPIYRKIRAKKQKKLLQN